MCPQGGFVSGLPKPGMTMGWSVMIPTFNDGEYLRQCLQSVLEATPPKSGMEVVVIDDRSTKGDPAGVAASYGSGRVKFLQNQTNLGSTGNFNRCILESKGKIVHILHADDWVENSFYTCMEDAFSQNPEVALLCCRVNIVNESGALLDLSPRLEFFEKPGRIGNELYRENPIRAPGVVVRREVYQNLGSFHPELRHAADWELWIRILKNYHGFFLNRPLANYRFFPNNETHRFYKTGENIRDLIRLYGVLRSRDRLFPGKEFLEKVCQLTRNQIRRYRKAGERDAVRANQAALRELLPQLSLKDKIQCLRLLAP